MDNTIQVGTRISGGPYHQGIGIVTRFEPGSAGCFMIDIAWETHEAIHVPAEVVTSLPYRVHTDRLGTAEEVAELRAKAAIHAAEAAAKTDEHTRAYATERERLIAEYPHLVRCSESVNALVAAGKNIRAELGKAFPGVKFTVRSSRYSGGDSITVSWTDGPTSEQVDAIIQKYRGGDFDGSDDSYSYRHNPWIDLFGDAKYVSSNRHYSDRMVESVMGRVARYLGGLDRVPTVEDYKQGNLRSIKQSGGCDFSSEVNRALSKHTYCV